MDLAPDTWKAIAVVAAIAASIIGHAYFLYRDLRLEFNDRIQKLEAKLEAKADANFKMLLDRMDADARESRTRIDNLILSGNMQTPPGNAAGAHPPARHSPMKAPPGA